MQPLAQLENHSIFMIREAFYRFPRMAVLWSMGKDSTALLWLIRKAFFGRVPFPVVHIDTTFKFPEMYAFRQKIAGEWDLDLVVGVNREALSRGVGYGTHDPVSVCHELKTVALNKLVSERGWQGIIVGIRHDEEGIRAKERFFSPRNGAFEWDYKDQPSEIWDHFQCDLAPRSHVRIHPLLEWTELDVWRYVRQEGIPVVPLYFARNHLRYRTLGCQPITRPVSSDADTVDKIIAELETTSISERTGRDQDHARRYAMQSLRARGYM